MVRVDTVQAHFTDVRFVVELMGGTLTSSVHVLFRVSSTTLSLC
jgi:hypothetical protein